MKKLILLLGAIAISVSFAQAQRGDYGVNRGARGGYHVNNGYQQSQTTTYRGEVRRTHSTYGRNRGQVRYRNRGHVRGGRYDYGYRNDVCRAGQRRTRYVWSDCGTFQWQIVEASSWVPQRYVIRNGCRRL